MLNEIVQDHLNCSHKCAVPNVPKNHILMIANLVDIMCGVVGLFTISNVGRISIQPVS